VKQIAVIVRGAKPDAELATSITKLLASFDKP
jgi:hypothetical protein